jgi:hypothetical protein
VSSWDSDSIEASDGVESSSSLNEESDFSLLVVLEVLLCLLPIIRFIASSSRLSSISSRFLFLPRFGRADRASCWSDTLEEASNASSSAGPPFVACSGSSSAVRLLFRLVEPSEGRTGPA